MDGVKLENVPAVFDGMEVSGGMLLNRKSIPKVNPTIAIFALTSQIAIYTCLYVIIALIFYRKWWRSSSTGYSRFITGIVSSFSGLSRSIRGCAKSLLVCEPCAIVFNFIFRRNKSNNNHNNNGSKRWEYDSIPSGGH
jgi:hypothetical protein